MNRGKEQYAVQAFLRCAILAVGIIGFSLADYTSVSVANGFILHAGFLAVLCAFIHVGMTLVRFFTCKTVGFFSKQKQNPVKIDNVNAVAESACSVAEILAFVLFWITCETFGESEILLGAVLPFLVVLDWAFFARHGEITFQKSAFCLVYPFVFAMAEIIKNPTLAHILYAFAFLVATASVSVFVFFADKKINKKYGQKRIPYPMPWDKLPVDISSAFGEKKEAGGHGFVQTQGENFVFEDGTPVKFWGVNFNSSANFPSHEHSEKVARRLSMAGINLVRFHQLDAEWASPNIFRFAKGKLLTDTRHFDEESMDRLDYLVSCLKKEGIYLYFDCITYRRFRAGDGVENSHLLPEGGKPYCEFDRTLIDLQKEFNRNFLLHKNPYTGLCYKDEPAIAMAEVINECNLLDADYMPITVEPYRTNFINMFLSYAQKHGIENPNVDLKARKDPLMREFMLQVHQSYVEEIIGDIRSLGARFPMTAMNRESDRSDIYINGLTDFSDSHAYWRGGDQRGFMNDPLCMQASNTLTKQLVTSAVDNKPFFVSEWNAPWPNEYRAEGTLSLAAIGALQNWSGYAVHTYRYGGEEQDYITEKLGRDISLGGSHTRGLFDCYNDPAKMAPFYHAALITRRGDIRQAQTKEVYTLTKDDLTHVDKERHLKLIYSPRSEEKYKVRFAMGEQTGKGFTPVPEGKILSDTEEIFRDSKKGLCTIDTARTKAVYGFCHGKTALKDFICTVENDFASVAVSSLTDADITASDNLLLTAVGRADNKDCKYNFWHTVQQKEGTAPIMADIIEGKISLRNSHENLKVWSVNYEGQLTGQLPTTYKDGILSFEIGKIHESVFYLIQTQ